MSAILFALPKIALDFGSVSASAGLSRSGFASRSEENRRACLCSWGLFSAYNLSNIEVSTNIAPEGISDNVFKLIGKDWLLITAGKEDSFNTMTASWGGLGILWHKEVSYCFIRPTRFTYEFMERSNIYTLSFFAERYRDALTILGTKSGRDGDKISAAGLTPAAAEPGAITFKEARLVLVCKKLYYQDLNPKNFLDAEIETHYPQKNYHRMYVGEIISALNL
jgi:flavin reductase (DIM6/NTAB) family NADH-FMN oxidoreductase RutF